METVCIPAMEAAVPVWRPGAATSYHYYTFGWLAAGVLRGLQDKPGARATTGVLALIALVVGAILLLFALTAIVPGDPATTLSLKACMSAPTLMFSARRQSPASLRVCRGRPAMSVPGLTVTLRSPCLSTPSAS